MPRPDAAHDDDDAPAHCYTTTADGRRLLDLDADPAFVPPPAALPGLQAALATLADVFRRSAAECRILGSARPGANCLHVGFEGQENASAARIQQAFREELAAAGVAAGVPLRLPSGFDGAATAQAARAIGHAVRRLRTLLIEHNSYLSGGLPYPFPDPVPGARDRGLERGLAIYRYPAAAAVDVTAGADHVAIRFAPGELGEVTSSGFYLPLLLGGDFTLTADYRLGTWRPDAGEAACVALFAQVEDSSRRYYAQRMSTGTGPHRILASMADTLSPAREIEGRAGRFRIRRQHGHLHCEHEQEPGAGFVLLGSAAAPGCEEMVIGAKIWSQRRCEGLEARVSRLCIEGRLADRQIDPVPVRPDPRSDPTSRS